MLFRAHSYFFSVVALAALVLPSCTGGALPSAPTALTGLAPSEAHPGAGRSWMKPSGGSKLLYIADSGSGTVKVYTYPGLAYDGELTGFSEPLFDCADKAGNVWIVDYVAGQAEEFAHGGTSPIRTLSGLSNPYECSVNRKNGDFAVAENLESSSVHLGEVAVFHQPSGPPSVYSDSNFGLIDGVTYDDSGNLFVDGYTPGDAFHYAKLPAGSSTFHEITLSQTPSAPGKVLWDGQYVDIADYGDTIYQTQGANVVDTIHVNLKNATLRGFCVDASRQRIVATDAYANQVGVFNYPAGGAALKKIKSGLNTPWDVVLSP